MTQLPAAFRHELEAAFEIPRLSVSARQKSTDGTEKFLFRLHDGEHIRLCRLCRNRPGDV